jgi:hypothetical protein
MRYLKLFESNEDINIDKDYIESCFVDFIDEDNFKLMFHGNRFHPKSSLTCEITIDIEDSSLPFSSSISEFTKRTEMRNHLFNRIEESLSKVKIEYPTIKHKVMDMTGADQTEVKIILSVSESYISYNTSGWFPI